MRPKLKYFQVIKLYAILALVILFQQSCSPKMHIIGSGMRQFNLSQNKYSKKKPYIKIESKKRDTENSKNKKY